MAADGTTSPQPSALAWRTDRRRNPRLVPAGNTTAALDRIMVLTRLLLPTTFPPERRRRTPYRRVVRGSGCGIALAQLDPANAR